MDPFSKTIGHKTARQVFLRMIENNRLPHAILLVGPKYVGKTHLVTELIQHLFNTSRHPSLISDVSLLTREIDQKTSKKKSAISVKQVRALVERLSMTPMEGNWKVAFIQEADRLSIGAANALLKTLEEPKGNSLIILRASSIESVLPTIVSRCQIFRLSPIAKLEISQALQKRGLSKTEADEISERSLGCPGIAIRFIQDSEMRARKETAIVQVETLMSASLPEQFRSVFELIPKTEVDKSVALSRLLDDWSEVLRAQMLKTISTKHSFNFFTRGFDNSSWRWLFSTRR
ncbi:AAA family ATPase [Candidatus Uhrbacteria bacterium]|nr:AAA family ATPase [Candidatus Uhrbacteria bacterium]